MNAYIVKLFPPAGKGMTLVFSGANAFTKFQVKLSQRGRYIHGDGKNLRLSTEIVVYLGNKIRDRSMITSTDQSATHY